MTYSYKYKRKNDSLWRKYFSRLSRHVSNLDTSTIITTATILTYILVVFIGAYILLRRSGVIPPNAFRKLSWRIFVYMIPPSLVLALETQDSNVAKEDDPFESENSYAATRTLGAKSLAVSRILGLGNTASGVEIAGSSGKLKSRALPGLFNRDNECYQNSIIQALASLDSFCDFVEKTPSTSPVGGHANLSGALQAIIAGLNSPDNHGRGLWTPWALKSMSSWQQQDAQEYYSRVIDEVEKDIHRAIKVKSLRRGTLSWPGLEVVNAQFNDKIDNMENSDDKKHTQLSELRNPLEGLQAQRVGCLQCGYVEGLSLIPFNCITLSLGRDNHYDLEDLLDSYTAIENIEGVECAKCTLLKQEMILQRLIQSRSLDKSGDQFLENTAQSRLEAVQAALSDLDFAETTLSRKCQVPGKARVSTTKTKQSVIARAPQCLTVHVNRSVFDERTGAQLKNYAKVRFPKLFDFSKWWIGSSNDASDYAIEKWETVPSKSMIAASADNEKDSGPAGTPGSLYILRALITHYGTHGDGHYIAWRKDPTAVEDPVNPPTWWRLSDEDVVEFDEDTVLQQGGVFMLFYERLTEDEAAKVVKQEPAAEQDEHKAKALVLEPDSPSNFLSAETRAALDAKLDKYTTPADNVVVHSNGHANKPLMKTVTEVQAETHRPTAPMKTGSDVETVKVDSAKGLLHVA